MFLIVDLFMLSRGYMLGYSQLQLGYGYMKDNQFVFQELLFYFDFELL